MYNFVFYLYVKVIIQDDLKKKYIIEILKSDLNLVRNENIRSFLYFKNNIYEKYHTAKKIVLTVYALSKKMICRSIFFVKVTGTIK